MRRVVLVACFALVAGCGIGDDRTVIRFWGMGREGEVVQEMVTGFEREYPDIRVEVQQIPWTAAHEKLLTAVVGRSTPDIAQLGNTWISEFTALDALEPLEPYILGSATVDSSHFFPGIWSTNVVDGTAYGIPWYVDTRVLFYRRDLLAEAGVDSIPGTWAGWREAMEAVKRRAGEDRYAIFLPVNEWTQPVILGLSAGSGLLNDRHTRGAFSGAPFRRAFRFYLDLFEAGLAPPVANNEIANMYQEFARGTFSMVITGPWNLGEFARRLPDSLQTAWTTAPMPGPEGPSTGISLAGGASLVLFRDRGHEDAAWKLVEYLSRPEQQLRFYELSGDLPAVREAWEDGGLAGEPRLRAFWTQLQRTAATPMIPEWELIATRLQERAEQAVRGGVEPDTALARLDRDVERILEKRRWLLEKQRGRDPEGGS